MAAKPEKKKIKVSVPKAKTVPPAPAATEISGEVAAPDLLKKGEVLDAVVNQTGVKRSDAKAVLESVLTLFSETLNGGREMQLPPLGKVKVAKTKTLGNGATALTVKIRQPKPVEDDAG